MTLKLCNIQILTELAKNKPDNTYINKQISASLQELPLDENNHPDLQKLPVLDLFLVTNKLFPQPSINSPKFKA